MKAKELAKYIINLAIEMDRPVSNLALQKILYFADVAYIKEKGEKFLEEDFEAWVHGPVNRELYNEYKAWGANRIDYEEYNAPDKKDLPEHIIKSIKDNIKISAWDLIQKSHNENGAWKKAYDLGNNTIITKELICEHEDKTKKAKNESNKQNRKNKRFNILL